MRLPPLSTRDLLAQAFAAHPSPEVLHEHLHAPLTVLPRGAGIVRREQHVGQVPERRCSGQRFLLAVWPARSGCASSPRSGAQRCSRWACAHWSPPRPSTITPMRAVWATASAFAPEELVRRTPRARVSTKMGRSTPAVDTCIHCSRVVPRSWSEKNCMYGVSSYLVDWPSTSSENSAISTSANWWGDSGRPVSATAKRRSVPAAARRASAWWAWTCGESSKVVMVRRCWGQLDRRGPHARAPAVLQKFSQGRISVHGIHQQSA